MIECPNTPLFLINKFHTTVDKKMLPRAQKSIFAKSISVNGISRYSSSAIREATRTVFTSDKVHTYSFGSMRIRWTQVHSLSGRKKGTINHDLLPFKLLFNYRNGNSNQRQLDFLQHFVQVSNEWDFKTFVRVIHRWRMVPFKKASYAESISCNHMHFCLANVVGLVHK